MCGQGERCHVNAKDVKHFGRSKFYTPKRITQLASSSVVLVDNRDKTAPKGIASGTLITRDCVLCAAHSLDFLNPADLTVRMFFECDAATAPKGKWPGKDAKAAEWRACTLSTPRPEAQVVDFLEMGNPGFDYAFLLLRWPGGTDTTPARIKIPRAWDIPRPDLHVQDEVILIAHPRAGGECQPTQAAPARVTGRNQRDPKGSPQNLYGLANFDTAPGASGGGVFSDRTLICGLLTSDTGSGTEEAFFELGEAARKQGAEHLAYGTPDTRLYEWMTNGSPMRDSDTRWPVEFVVAP
jgi:hypothetical protein